MSNKVDEIGYVKKSIKVGRVAWTVAYTLFFRPFGTPIFCKWRNFILRCFGADIVKTAVIYSTARIWAPWNLRMEAGSCLGPNVICYNQAVVKLEKNATVSQYSYLCTAGHKTDELNSSRSGLVVAPITIKRNAWVGTRAFIGMGVEIGENAVVGATASVYKDVEPGAIVGGNPAKIIKYRDEK